MYKNQLANQSQEHIDRLSLISRCITVFENAAIIFQGLLVLVIPLLIVYIDYLVHIDRQIKIDSNICITILLSILDYLLDRKIDFIKIFEKNIFDIIIGILLVFSICFQILKKYQRKNAIIVILVTILFYISTNAIFYQELILCKTYVQKQKILKSKYTNNSSENSIIYGPLVKTRMDYAKLVELIKNRNIKNIFFSKQLITWLIQNNELGNFLKAVADNKESETADRLVVFFDLETYIDDASFPDMPTQMAIGTLQDFRKIHDIYMYYASFLSKKFYIDAVFGPVVDKKFSYTDKTLSSRSFGANDLLNYQYALAACLGIEDAGVIPIIKHFPGHPQYTLHDNNPHYTNATTTHSEEFLRENSKIFEKILFNRYIFSHTLMTDHIIITNQRSISDEKQPFTLVFNKELSTGGVTSLLRNLTFLENYKYIVSVSDDINMISELKTQWKLYEDRNPQAIENYISKLNSYINKALLSGHTFVLVRDIFPTDIKSISRSFSPDTPKDQMRQLDESCNKANKFRNFCFNFTSAFETNQDKKKFYKPAILLPKEYKKLSGEDALQLFIKNEVFFVFINDHEQKARNLSLDDIRHGRNLFITTYYEHEDFCSSLLKTGTREPQKPIIDISNSKIFYIKTNKAIINNFASTLESIKRIDINSFNNIYIATASDKIFEILQYIHKNYKYKKNIFLYILNSPDIIYSGGKINETASIIKEINVICLFKNSRGSIRDYIKFLKTDTNERKIKSCIHTNIDIPDFYPHVSLNTMPINSDIDRMIINNTTQNSTPTTMLLYYALCFTLLVAPLITYKIYTHTNTNTC